MNKRTAYSNNRYVKLKTKGKPTTSKKVSWQLQQLTADFPNGDTAFPTKMMTELSSLLFKAKSCICLKVKIKPRRCIQYATPVNISAQAWFLSKAGCVLHNFQYKRGHVQSFVYNSSLKFWTANFLGAVAYCTRTQGHCYVMCHLILCSSYSNHTIWFTDIILKNSYQSPLNPSFLVFVGIACCLCFLYFLIFLWFLRFFSYYAYTYLVLVYVFSSYISLRWTWTQRRIE